MSRSLAIAGGLLFLLAASPSRAQDCFSRDFRLLGVTAVTDMRDDSPASVLDDTLLAGVSPAVDIVAPATLPLMSADLALVTYLSLANRQLADLGAYSDATVIEADLPDTAQHGKFELRRYFQAPRSMAFAAIHFAGDGFVKTNIITRLLQSEQEHVQKGEGPQTAITGENYKFSYKGFDTINGRVAYIYQVKPRHKRPGLFKGRILVDAATGRLRRAEGTMAKSPSFFIKKIEFVQEYGEYGPFSLPEHLHSEAKTRLVGRAVVEMYHSDYRALTMAELQSVIGSSAAGGSSSSN